MNNKPLNIPLLILDVLGTGLLGLGLFTKFSGQHFVPEVYRFANYEIYMIVIGFFLMIPFSLSMFRRK